MIVIVFIITKDSCVYYHHFHEMDGTHFSVRFCGVFCYVDLKSSSQTVSRDSRNTIRWSDSNIAVINDYPSLTSELPTCILPIGLIPIYYKKVMFLSRECSNNRLIFTEWYHTRHTIHCDRSVVGPHLSSNYSSFIHQISLQ
jgi:hypothetical protein